MKKNIKIALRDVYTPIRESIAKKQDSIFTKGLEQQLTKVICLVNQRQRRDLNFIGSYLYDPSREIKPPTPEGYTYAFPYFSKKKKGMRAPLMEFKVVNQPEKINETVYGIKVPDHRLPTVYPGLILVPLTCFNYTSKHRIGYGGGYYDRYIASIRQQSQDALFIGIGSELLKVNEAFEEEGDEALDYVITQTNIY